MKANRRVLGNSEIQPDELYADLGRKEEKCFSQSVAKSTLPCDGGLTRCLVSEQSVLNINRQRKCHVVHTDTTQFHTLSVMPFHTLPLEYAT